MRYVYVILGLIISILLFTGCAQPEEEGDKLLVQTTLYPLYDFVREIGGERVKAELLLPPGVSPHSYEPSPRDMVRIDRSDLLFYLGRSLDPWVDRLLSEKNRTKAVPVSSGIALMETRSANARQKNDSCTGCGDHGDHNHGDHDHEDHDHEDHDHGDDNHEDHNHEDHNHEDHNHEDHNHEDH
ncbi:MAG: metal ABC transporter substrate-binding protein, partial [Fibrobacterota bacterium]